MTYELQMKRTQYYKTIVPYGAKSFIDTASYKKVAETYFPDSVKPYKEEHEIKLLASEAGEAPSESLP